MKKTISSVVAAMLFSTVPINVLANEKVEELQNNPTSIILEDFEGDISDWIVSGAKYKGAIERTTELTRFGEGALKITYDFTNQTGTSGIYAGAEPKIELEGQPKKIGMWVYGDGNGLWLRGSLLDANGQTINLDFTESDPNGALWKGWKYVEADISTSDAYQAPYKLNLAVRYMSSVDATKVAGTIYVDNIRAVYADDPTEDTTNPTFSEVSITPSTNKPTITIKAADNVQLDAAKFSMKLNDALVAATFNQETNELTYTVEQPLADGMHQIWAEIYDTAGNSTFQTFDIEIQSGGPKLHITGDATPLAGTPYSTHIQLENAQQATGFDAVLAFNAQQATALDANEAVDGVQLHVHEALQPYVTKNEIIDGRIHLSVANVPSHVWPAEALATLHTKMAPSAAGTWQLHVEQGTMHYADAAIGSLPFKLAPFEAAIEQPLKVSVTGRSVGTPMTIRVVDTAGQPVEGATLNVLNAPVLIQTTKETIIYKGGSGVQGEPHMTIPAGTYLYTTNQPTAAFPFYRVYMPDGQTRYFHVAAADAEKQNLQELLPTSDANGEIRTNLLSLTKQTLSYQVVKDELVSAVSTLPILAQLGSEKIDNVSLSIGADSATTMDIGWKTGTTVTSGIVQYVEQTDALRFESEHVQQQASNVQLLTTATGEMHTHHVTLTNLKPGTTYVYRAGDGNGQWTEEAAFTTAAADEQFDFLFATDTQASNTADFAIWTKLVNGALEKFSTSQFILHGGDLVDDGDDFTEWQAYLDASPFAAQLPIMAVMGNHEAYGTGEETFKQLFQYTSNSPAGQEGYAYSFDYKNARFIMLNTELGADNMRTQAQWLKEQVATAGDKWTIVVMHRSPYSSNPLGGGSETAASIFTPVIEEAKVDLVLTGHDHSYMRTTPMNGGQPVTNDGTTYIIGGSAGPKFYPEETNDYTAKLYGEDKQVISNIAINGDTLQVTAMTIDGDIVDEVQLTKRERTTAPAPIVPITPVPTPVAPLPHSMDVTAEQLQQKPAVELQDATITVPTALTWRGTVHFAAAVSKQGVTIDVTDDEQPVSYVKEPFVVEIDNEALIAQLQAGHVLMRQTANSLAAVPYTLNDGIVTLHVHTPGQFVVTKRAIAFADTADVFSAEAIHALAARGIINGTSATTFKPYDAIKRGQFAAMLSRGLGIAATSKAPFNDVTNTWFEQDVTALYELGIIQGKTAQTFGGSDVLTRQQAALMMHRLLTRYGIELPAAEALTYTDASLVASYAKEAVSIVQQLGIMTGTEDNQFNPHATLTRAQMAKVLYETLQEIGYM